MTEECSGCSAAVVLDKKSNRIYCSVLLLGESQEIFKNKLCPCRKCVVKAICRHRKNNLFSCQIFSKAVKKIYKESKK
jgi:hypothetical protein